MEDILLNEWLTFAAVVEAQSFSAAAQTLRLSPSVVSKRISHLEKNLHTRLFQRSTRHLVLTESGQLFYQHCQRIKEEIEAAKAAISQHQQQPQGLLRVYAPMAFGQLQLVTAMSEFMNKHPEIHIELILGSHTPNLIDAGIDVAISIKELPDSSLIAKRIAKRSIGVYASPSYIANHGKPQHPNDLLKHNCLVYQHHIPRSAWEFNDAKKKPLLVTVKGNFKTNSSQALAKAALAGMGIAKLPSFLVMQEVREGKLLRLLEKYCPTHIGIYAIYPHKAYLAKKTQLFIDFLSKRFASSKFWLE